MHRRLRLRVIRASPGCLTNFSVRCYGHWLDDLPPPQRRTVAVSELNRRRFMAGLAAAIVGGVGAARYAIGSPPHVAAATASSRRAPLTLAVAKPSAMPVQQPLLPPPPQSARVALPGNGVLTVLPGDADVLALTVDDGVS